MDRTGLNDVAELHEVTMSSTDRIHIVDNNSLGDCTGKTLVRKIRNNPVLSSFSSSTNHVLGNGPPEC